MSMWSQGLETRIRTHYPWQASVTELNFFRQSSILRGIVPGVPSNVCEIHLLSMLNVQTFDNDVEQRGLLTMVDEGGNTV